VLAALLTVALCAPLATAATPPAGPSGAGAAVPRTDARTPGAVPAADGVSAPNGTHAPGGVRAPDGARVVSAVRVADRQIDLTIDSPALHGTAKVRLLTPDGWDDRGPGAHWPTLWLLHGCCNDYTSWTKDLGVADVPQLHHVLVVMPEAGPAGFYSDWAGAPGADAPGWETFHLDEVRYLVEHGYGAGPDRAVAGLSMGGFGALSYAGRHPGMFRAAASFSGVTDTLRTADDSAFVGGLVSSTGEPATALWGDPVGDRARWAAHNPADLARTLARIPLFVSCGDGTPGPYDPPGGAVDPTESLLHGENVSLVSALQAAHPRDLHTDLYGPGTHSAPYWHREFLRALPMLLGALHVPPAR
jgi:S-formylglutathione hydrolase FrmB